MKKFFTVLGGMGTLATESYVHLLDERTPIKRDQDYLDYIIVNHATIPDRTGWILDHSKPDPLPVLLEDVKQQSLLKPEFFVLICNTAHYFYHDLQAATDIPILNMLQETVKAIAKVKPGAKRVGLLGTYGTLKSGIYDDYITKAGYTLLKPDEEIMAMTEDLIYNDIKQKGHSDSQKYHRLVKKMTEEMNCDIVILGCTELSLAEAESPETEYPVISSQSVIVDKSLELGLQQQKGKQLDE